MTANEEAEAGSGRGPQARGRTPGPQGGDVPADAAGPPGSARASKAGERAQPQSRITGAGSALFRSRARALTRSGFAGVLFFVLRACAGDLYRSCACPGLAFRSVVISDVQTRHSQIARSLSANRGNETAGILAGVSRLS